MENFATTIIAAIITGVFSLLGIVLVYYLKQRKRTKQAPGAVLPLSPQEARRMRIRRVVASVMLAVGFLLIILSGYVGFSFAHDAASCSENTGVSFTVDYPANKQEVDRVTTMYGTACNLAKGQHAWPIALAETTNKYYLLGRELRISDAHTWSIPITIGDTSGDVRGHPYMVSVIIVNDATNAMLNSIISKPYTMHTIAHIPPGAQIMFTITLIRK